MYNNVFTVKWLYSISVYEHGNNKTALLPYLINITGIFRYLSTITSYQELQVGRERGRVGSKCSLQAQLHSTDVQTMWLRGLNYVHEKVFPVWHLCFMIENGILTHILGVIDPGYDVLCDKLSPNIKQLALSTSPISMFFRSSALTSYPLLSNTS